MKAKIMFVAGVAVVVLGMMYLHKEGYLKKLPLIGDKV